MMFDDEDKTRAALHKIVETPVPPATTTAEQVIRSGRRRILLHRGGAVAAAVVVVAAIGVAATAFGGPPDVQPGGTSTTPPPPPPSTNSVIVPPTDLPTTFPDENTPPPDGWTRVPATDHDGGKCESPLPGPGPHLALPARAEVENTVLGTLRELTGQAEVTLFESTWDTDADKPNGPVGHLTAEVPAEDNSESVRVEVSSFAGTPVQAADGDIHRHNNCVGPARRVLEDGTVLQLYPPQAALADQPFQNVHAYLPSGRQYQVFVWGGSETGQPWGTGQLPLTPVQMAELVQRLVTDIG